MKERRHGQDEPRTFLFDTGEGLTMIAPGLACEAGCKPWGYITGFWMTGDRIATKRCDGWRSAYRPSLAEPY